ncbi:polymerase [Capsaspora owczarzaki ATCC 30864]|uniref:DNA polymerase lambda n=1 Tax=Capsaspora owczarzaki (strain ATCC 30864) TaxID=595528 RepID=A0A0D2X0V6_CAPO3|nr:polymerase [Capsaspora owczarzaki ATCC 30864]KJE89724.1 polymerase [Capsaspora owczarzaki ATCC 30864]|eukprot:XP_004366026.2 polymerase [Capsaspora owczarzaki ATCC 30864]
MARFFASSDDLLDCLQLELSQSPVIQPTPPQPSSSSSSSSSAPVQSAPTVLLSERSLCMLDSTTGLKRRCSTDDIDAAATAATLGCSSTTAPAFTARDSSAVVIIESPVASRTHSAAKRIRMSPPPPLPGPRPHHSGLPLKQAQNSMADSTAAADRDETEAVAMMAVESSSSSSEQLSASTPVDNRAFRGLATTTTTNIGLDGSQASNCSVGATSTASTASWTAPPPATAATSAAVAAAPLRVLSDLYHSPCSCNSSATSTSNASAKPSSSARSAATATRTTTASKARATFAPTCIYLIDKLLGAQRWNIFVNKVTALGGRLCSHLCPNTTHLVTALPRSRLLETEPDLVLVADRVLAVAAEWLSESIRRGTPCDTASFLLTIPSPEEQEAQQRREEMIAQREEEQQALLVAQKAASSASWVRRAAENKKRLLGTVQKAQQGDSSGDSSDDERNSSMPLRSRPEVATAAPPSTSAANPSNDPAETTFSRFNKAFDAAFAEVDRSHSNSRMKLKRDTGVKDEQSGSDEAEGSGDSDWEQASVAEEQASSTRQTRWLSTFACGRPSSDQPINHNKQVTDIFEMLEGDYRAQKDTWRAMGYQKAITALKHHHKPIESFAEALALPNVGERLAKKVWEIVSTGHLRRLDDRDPRLKVILEMSQVYGVGPTTAQKLYAKGIHSMDQLRAQASQLPPIMQIGVKHYDDLLKKIPRAEVTLIGTKVYHFAKQINSGVLVAICGSYRRGKDTCGDVDILLSHPDGRAHTDIYNRLIPILKRDGLLTDHLSEGHDGTQHKYMGICRVTEHDWDVFGEMAVAAASCAAFTATTTSHMMPDFSMTIGSSQSSSSSLPSASGTLDSDENPPSAAAATIAPGLPTSALPISSTAGRVPDGRPVPFTNFHRRIDLIAVPLKEWGTALLYFTGSGYFNRSMRLLARKRHMSLSQHSLNVGVKRLRAEKLTEGEPLLTPTEHSVFEALGLPYLAPHERNV